jgi:aldehyde:ferredoxin oxidoreductase
MRRRFDSSLAEAASVSRLLLDEGAAHVDPSRPSRPLVFAFSPLVGSPLTTVREVRRRQQEPTDRTDQRLAGEQRIRRRRQTPRLRRADDRRPRAELSVLVIEHDGSDEQARVRLISAAKYRGASCQDTEGGHPSDLGADYRVASIGPAGEHLVRYATISHDGRHAGRGGSGAVLGAKNIKAIAVRGKQRVEWAHPQDLTALSRDLSKRSFGPATAKYRELGTATNLLTFNRFNALPTRNFQSGTFEEAVNLSPEQLTATRTRTRESCVTCTIGCEHIYSIALKTPVAADLQQKQPVVADLQQKQPVAADLQVGPSEERGVRVEYESLFALGSLCGIGDSNVVLRASQRCDELGLDTISAGGTIAFAMECVDRGWLDEPWLRFGSGDALLRAIELIGAREGLGDVLAEGSRRAAHAIGHNSITIAPQVKGLEIPGYEPRALQTMALGFAVGTRGADHNRSGAYEVDFSDKVDRRNVTLDAVRYAIETEDKPP